jgi:hypothetical protein
MSSCLRVFLSPTAAPAVDDSDLASHYLRLVGHYSDLRTNENSSGQSSTKTKYGNSVGFTGEIQCISGNDDSFSLKRLDIVTANQSHKHWLSWSLILSGVGCTYASRWLLRRGCSWLSDTGDWVP